ncbi:BTAD domain-containing putative transcriptional regulator [Streptomyces sp. B22F1]|uniref:AfsR/SARP family transcriptional regulator n=1 Tax=Streptomyces sp. B22F1 TaxID=3153566 RepID=UPI00325CAE3F
MGARGRRDPPGRPGAGGRVRTGAGFGGGASGARRFGVRGSGSVKGRVIGDRPLTGCVRLAYVRIGVLGPLEVAVGGVPVEIAGGRLRALLVRLALDPGRYVGTTLLADGLWGDDAPDYPGNALQSSSPGRAARSPLSDVLAYGPAGYRLALPPEAVDAVRFERQAHAGREALAAGAAAARRLLEEALTLWRGPALADVADAPPAPTSPSAPPTPPPPRSAAASTACRRPAPRTACGRPRLLPHRLRDERRHRARPGGPGGADSTGRTGRSDGRAPDAGRAGAGHRGVHGRRRARARRDRRAAGPPGPVDAGAAADDPGGVPRPGCRGR